MMNSQIPNKLLQLNSQVKLVAIFNH